MITMIEDPAGRFELRIAFERDRELAHEVGDALQHIEASGVSVIDIAKIPPAILRAAVEGMGRVDKAGRFTIPVNVGPDFVEAECQVSATYKSKRRK